MSKYFGPTQNYSLDVDYEMDQNNSLNLYLDYENTNQQFKKFTSASGPFSYLGIYNVDRKSLWMIIIGLKKMKCWIWWQSRSQHRDRLR